MSVIKNRVNNFAAIYGCIPKKIKVIGGNTSGSCNHLWFLQDRKNRFAVSLGIS